jgi:hypothetical protein
MNQSKTFIEEPQSLKALAISNRGCATCDPPAVVANGAIAQVSLKKSWGHQIARVVPPRKPAAIHIDQDNLGSGAAALAGRRSNGRRSWTESVGWSNDWTGLDNRPARPRFPRSQPLSPRPPKMYRPWGTFPQRSAVRRAAHSPPSARQNDPL